MRRRMKRSSDSAEPNMTPMLDVVFILLIFFIVTSTFLQERGLVTAQPPSDAEQEQPPNPVPSILIQVDDPESAPLEVVVAFRHPRGRDVEDVLSQVESVLHPLAQFVDIRVVAKEYLVARTDQHGG